jgi:hypothetical protein
MPMQDGPRPVASPSLEVLLFLTLAEFTAAATSQSVDAGFSLPAGCTLEDVIVDVDTALVLASATGLTLKVGTSSDDDAYLTATSVLATGRTAASGAAGSRTPSTAQALKLKLTSDVNLGDGTATSLTAGKVAVRVRYREDRRAFA